MWGHQTGECSRCVVQCNCHGKVSEVQTEEETERIHPNHSKWRFSTLLGCLVYCLFYNMPLLAIPYLLHFILWWLQDCTVARERKEIVQKDQRRALCWQAGQHSRTSEFWWCKQSTICMNTLLSYTIGTSHSSLPPCKNWDGYYVGLVNHVV